MIAGWSPRASPASSPLLRKSPEVIVRTRRLSSKCSPISPTKTFSLHATQTSFAKPVKLEINQELEGLVNSPKNLVEISKMRKLDEARRNWQASRRLGTLNGSFSSQYKSNSPSSYQSSPSRPGLPSINRSDGSSSPLTKLKAFGKRFDFSNLNREHFQHNQQNQ